jgi:hypothetical protein
MAAPPPVFGCSNISNASDLDAMILGISMILRAEMALVVVYQCSQLGENVVPREVFAGMVTVSVLTSIAASCFAPAAG